MGREMKRFTRPHEKRLYKCYHAMKTRCLNPRDRNYARYGGRGITVCQEWLKGFDYFYQWALQNGYADNLTLDRRNNDGNYEPSNCRWITIQRQMQNTSKNIYVIYGGKKVALAHLAEIYEIPEYVLRQRYHHGDRNEYLLRKYTGKSKKVQCIETGKIYDSIKDAEKEFNLKGGIEKVIIGQNKTAAGHTWRLANERG